MENRQPEEAALERGCRLVYPEVEAGKNEAPSLTNYRDINNQTCSNLAESRWTVNLAYQEDRLRGYPLETPVVGLLDDKDEEKGKGLAVAALAS